MKLIPFSEEDPEMTNMIQKFVARLRADKKGQGLVEYGLLIAGVALISAAAVSLFGHKTSDMIGATAAILPGAHQDDNNAIQSGHLIETGTVGANGAIAVDAATIAANKGTPRLGANVLGGTAGAADGFDGLVVESGPTTP